MGLILSKNNNLLKEIPEPNHYFAYYSSIRNYGVIGPLNPDNPGQLLEDSTRNEAYKVPYNSFINVKGLKRVYVYIPSVKYEQNQNRFVCARKESDGGLRWFTGSNTPDKVSAFFDVSDCDYIIAGYSGELTKSYYIAGYDN